MFRVFRWFIPVVLGTLVFALPGKECYCGEELGAAANVPGEAPTVVAPGGLTEREQNDLEKKYRYQVRNKELLLKPLEGSPETFLLPDWETQRGISKKELLYRYFGAAAELKDAGRYDEAVEVLKYIAVRDPKDKYVAEYLKRTIAQGNMSEKKWRLEVLRDAGELKKLRITELLRDGREFYDNGRVEEAMASFSDVLSLDSGNAKATKFMAAISKEYAKKMSVERIAGISDTKGADVPVRLDPSGQGLEAERSATGGPIGADDDLKKEADQMLDEKELESEISRIVADQKEKTYRLDALTIGEGDVITVIVVGHQELSGEIMVPYGGRAALPLVGDEIDFGGMTTTRAAEAVAAVMERYVRAPDVRVEIREYRSKLFYVVDDMGCTPYPITRPDMTLRDALFTADWGTNKALGRVLLVSPHKFRPVVRKVDAFALIYRGRLACNPKIKDGDVIYVPTTIAGKTSQVISDTVAPFSELQNARDLWLQGKWTRKGHASMFRIYEDTEKLPQVVGGG